MCSLCLFFFVSYPCGAPWMFPFPVSFLGTALSVFVSFVCQKHLFQIPTYAKKRQFVEETNYLSQSGKWGIQTPGTDKPYSGFRVRPDRSLRQLSSFICFLQCKITHFPDTAQFYRKKFGGELKYGLPVGINRGGFSWTYCPRIAPRCPLTARGTTGRVLAKRAVCFIFASAKRGRAQAFPLFAF